LRECWLAHERLRVSVARSINRAEILTARKDSAAEAAEVAAAEAAAAEAAAAVEIAAAAEAAAAAGGAAKAAADALGARAALEPELPKEHSGGADGMAEDAEDIPGRPVFCGGGPRKTDNSRRVAQQRGSKRGSPGREIDTDQSIEIT
jgi:membrane protein involved in colicin uptake